MKKNETITLRIKDLCKSYGTIVASDNINLTAQKGDIIALIGANGAGKSTLMNMIAGFLSPDAGKIEILGRDIAKYPLFAKENIGFLPEGSPLYADLTVKRFMFYMAELRGINKQKVLDIAKVTKIDNVWQQKIETLSKGYQRRVGFAQSILSNPPILLLDEPTDGLDPNQKDYIRGMIKNMTKDKTILISTHLLEEAEMVCNRIVLIHKAKILADATLPELLRLTDCKNIAEAFRKLTMEEK